MWFNNPSILLNNPDQFIPINKFTVIEKVNALARLGIYSSIIIWVLNKENKWYYLSAGLIIFSYLVGKQSVDHFTQYTNYKYLNPTFNYDTNTKKNMYEQSKPNLQYLETTKPYNNWNNRINDRTNFESWCYNDNLINTYNLDNQNNNTINTFTEQNNSSKNIDVYYDKNKINNLPNNKLTINLNLV